MATRCIASVLVLLVAASASSEFAKQVSETQLLGDSIPKVLQKQWESKLAQQKKNISSAEVALSKSLPGPVKADVTAAIKQLNEVEQKIEAALENFVKLQAKQATEISKQYSTLLTQRLSAKGLSATDETAIHKIREESQKIVNSWVPALSKIHDDAHKQFENAFRSLAEKSSKLKTPQIGDQIRVAIENIGAQLLNVLVEEQNADITLLTGIQFNLCNNFFQKAESILINLLVAAKTSQNSSPVLSTPQNAPEPSKPSSVKTYAKPTETQAKISETKPSPTTTNQNKPSSQSSNSKTSASEEFDYDEYQN